MPYLQQDQRKLVGKDLQENGLAFVPENPAELNFVISSLIANYMRANGVRYRFINDMVGALASAQAEFQRVVVGPYEEKKLKENGGVYDNLR